MPLDIQPVSGSSLDVQPVSDNSTYVGSGAIQGNTDEFWNKADNVWDGFWGSVGDHLKTASQVPGVSGLFPASSDVRQPVSSLIGTAGKLAENLTNPLVGDMGTAANLTNILGAVSPMAKDAIQQNMDASNTHISKDAAGFIAGVMTDPRTYAGVNETNKNLLQIDPTAEQRAAEALNQGVDLTPGQATQSKLLSMLEGFGNRYLFSTGTFDKFYNSQLEAWHGIARNILAKFGDSPALDAVKEEGAHRIANYLNNVAPEDRAVMADAMSNSLGDTISNLDVGQYQKSVLEQTTKKVSDAFGQKFADLGNTLPPNNVIPHPEWSDAVQKLLGEQESLIKTGAENKPLLQHLIKVAGIGNQESPLILSGVQANDISPTMQAYLDAHPEINTTPTPPTSYADIQANLGMYREAIQKNDIAAKFGSDSAMMGNTTSGSYKFLSKALRRDVANYVNDIGTKAKTVLEQAPPNDPEALAQLQKLSNFPEQFNSVRREYALSKQAFNDPTVTKWLNGKYQAGTVSQDSLNNVGTVLDNLQPEDRVPIQQNVLTQLMTNPRTNTLDPGTFMNNVNKLGIPALSRVIPENVLPEIVQNQSMLNSMGSSATMSANPSETARGLMTAGASFKSLTALMDLVGGNVTGAIKGISKTILLPNLIAKAYLSQPVREALIKGLNFPSASGMALNMLRNGAVVGALTNSGRSGISNDDSNTEAQ